MRYRVKPLAWLLIRKRFTITQNGSGRRCKPRPGNLLVLVSIFSKLLFSFVSRNFTQLAFSSTGHIKLLDLKWDLLIRGSIPNRCSISMNQKCVKSQAQEKKAELRIPSGQYRIAFDHQHRCRLFYKGTVKHAFGNSNSVMQF